MDRYLDGVLQACCPPQKAVIGGQEHIHSGGFCTGKVERICLMKASLLQLLRPCDFRRSQWCILRYACHQYQHTAFSRHIGYVVHLDTEYITPQPLPLTGLNP